MEIGSASLYSETGSRLDTASSFDHDKFYLNPGDMLCPSYVLPKDCVNKRYRPKHICRIKAMEELKKNCSLD